MLTTEFKKTFLPVLKNKIKVKEYSEKSYSKRYGNISCHKDEYNKDVFNYIIIDEQVFHIAYPYDVELTKEGKNGMYGIVKGDWLVKIDLEYLKPFIDFQELEVPIQETQSLAEPTYVWETPVGNLDVEFIVEDLTSSEEPKGELFQIAQNIGDLLEYKNKKYGNSALAPLEIFTGKSKVGSRLDDKLARIKNSVTLSKNDVSDCLGYLILVCKENNWNTFNEFKD